MTLRSSERGELDQNQLALVLVELNPSSGDSNDLKITASLA